MLLEILTVYLFICSIYIIYSWIKCVNPIINEINKFYEKKIGFIVKTFWAVGSILVFAIEFPGNFIFNTKTCILDIYIVITQGFKEEDIKGIVFATNDILKNLNKV